VKNFSIVIPVFNEALNIVPLLNLINDNLKNFKKEIIVVNDCSTDQTSLELKNIQNKFLFKIINHHKNLGQSQAIRTGVLNSKFKTIVTIDGDGQNDPRDIEKLVNLYFNYEDIKLVAGIRLKRKDNLIKIVSSKIANKIRMAILKDNCPDTGCSLKVFDKEIFLAFPFFNGIHRFLPALFIGYGFKTEYLNVSHNPRMNGISKYGTIDRMFRGIRDIFKVINIIKLNIQND
tara:strand:- start:2648 stop:3343 length:696 start_codon:yes stop_codon:yes gene_type:complete